MTKKKSFIPAVFKVFIALTSFTGTIGLWNFLSNRDLNTAEAALDPTQTQLEFPELPPIPTLIPLIIVDELYVSNEPVQSTTETVPLRTVQITQPVPSIQVPNSASSAAVVIPTPVTKTKSS